ncbi:MAG: TMEM165/GDT1 family protein [Calothrix sp. MO_167.B42]|nr:TMEM165/GDT1 family protein [Calothrix sp. MO_167.B42]
MKIDSAPKDITTPSQTPSQEIPNTNGVIDTTESIKNSDGEHGCVDGLNYGKQKTTVVFGTTFVTIFLAEIGDKTQLSTLLMSAESHEPWMVFIGSAVALVTTSLLGVLVGSWMASKLSPKTIEIAAGMMLLLISFMLIGDVFLS